MHNFHIKLLLLLFANQFLMQCKEKCNSDNVTRTPIFQEVREYFGSYKAGSYWVYQNQDSSKTDSVYVIFYSHDWHRSVTLCREEEVIELQYHSSNKFLLRSGLGCVKIGGGSAHLNACPNNNLLYGISEVMMYENKFYSDNRICNPVSSIVLNRTTYTGELLKITLQEISEQGDVYIKKNGGIVGWTTPSDTFSLTKQNIIL